MRKKRYKGKRDSVSLYKTLLEAERLIASQDKYQQSTGETLKRLMLKLIAKRKQEAEEAEKKAIDDKYKKTGPYTHAQATAPKD